MIPHRSLLILSVCLGTVACGGHSVETVERPAGPAGAAGTTGAGGMAGASATGGSAGESGASGLAGAGGGSNGGDAGSQNGGAGGGGAGGCDGGQQLCQGVCSPPGDKLCTGLAVSFSEPTVLSADGRSVSVSVADFNEDGIQDVVVSWTLKTFMGPGGKCRIVVFPGGAGGQFGPKFVDLGVCASDVVAGDVDGDGHSDIVFGGVDGLQYFAGKGDGTFTLHNGIASKHPPLSLVGADADGNGSLDIVGIPVVDSDGLVRVFSGSGTGDFTLLPAIPSGLAKPTRLALRSPLGNAKLGFVVVGPDASVGILPEAGAGKPSFASSGLADQIPAPSVAVAKLDTSDLVVAAAPSSQRLVLYPLQGDVLSAPKSIKVVGEPVSVYAADVNADGRDDLVVLSTHVQIWTGDGKGNFAPPVKTSDADGTDVLATDLNGDKLPDLIVWGSNFVRTFMNTSK